MPVIRLNSEELARRQQEKGWTDEELVKRIGVARSQLWRVRLSPSDSRYNAPGQLFIAGVLRAFPEATFEELFFLADELRGRNTATGTEGGD